MKPQGLYHISEVLREFYDDRARENLASIVINGIHDIVDSGGKPELFALMELGAMTSGDIYRAHHKFLSDSLWRN
ncbi:MAG: hypothetical protein AABX54_04765 [Nanoarchaeota archaeon]